MWHHETKQRNIKLEDENGKLRAEVRQLKSLLLAHQDCSVSKAMALGRVELKFCFFNISNISTFYYRKTHSGWTPQNDSERRKFRQYFNYQ